MRQVWRGKKEVPDGEPRLCEITGSMCAYISSLALVALR